ncbi:MAG: glutaredoxin family protein [Anaerolineae bacterium]
MHLKHVPGEDRGSIVLYALSTCGWCKKTKRLLDELGVEYYYADVDLLGEADKDAVLEEVRRWNPRCSFPTLVFNNETCVVGYREEQIREAMRK